MVFLFLGFFFFFLTKIRKKNLNGPNFIHTKCLSSIWFNLNAIKFLKYFLKIKILLLTISGGLLINGKHTHTYTHGVNETRVKVGWLKFRYLYVSLNVKHIKI